jgi:hypothetical protein
MGDVKSKDNQFFRLTSHVSRLTSSVSRLTAFYNSAFAAFRAAS